jgi:hypothetical protein
VIGPSILFMASVPNQSCANPGGRRRAPGRRDNRPILQLWVQTIGTRLYDGPVCRTFRAERAALMTFVPEILPYARPGARMA